jgi:hypothetical protein
MFDYVFKILLSNDLTQPNKHHYSKGIIHATFHSVIMALYILDAYFLYDIIFQILQQNG